MYDYIILTVTNPAFKDNIDIMLNNIYAVGGTIPSIRHNRSGAMAGTNIATGRFMLHFRMKDRHTELSLVTFLEQGMLNPKPPLSIKSIRSRDKVDGNHDIVLDLNKAEILPYLKDVIDSVNTDGTFVLRPPNVTDEIHLSHYIGAPHII